VRQVDVECVFQLQRDFGDVEGIAAQVVDHPLGAEDHAHVALQMRGDQLADHLPAHGVLRVRERRTYAVETPLHSGGIFGAPHQPVDKPGNDHAAPPARAAGMSSRSSWR
jgi:hypothetical protein